MPIYLTITFWISTIGTLVLFHWVTSNMKSDRYKANLILMALTGWIILQGILAKEGLYNRHLDALPPYIALFGAFPTFLIILVLFTTKSGRSFIDQLPIQHLSYLHTIRIPVELVLFWLMIEGEVPELMTFEGRNFDILAGISAPFIGYFLARNPSKNRTALIIWNILCLGLLINIVIHAFLAAPLPLQILAFDQPNVAVLKFPFIWLPTFIVPVVLFCHLVSLRKLGKRIY